MSPVSAIFLALAVIVTGIHIWNLHGRVAKLEAHVFPEHIKEPE